MHRTPERPFHNVRVARPTGELEDLCLAYLYRAGEDEFFSHATAARLWGLPVPGRGGRRGPLDVAVVVPRHPPQTFGVRGHQLARADVRHVAVLPVASPADVWMHLASTLPLDDLVVLGDCLVRRREPLATLEELRTVVARGTGSRGIRTLRVALPLVRPLTDSPQETLLRLALLRGGLPEPLVGHRISDGAVYVGTPDLAYPEDRVCLEYEGDGHRTDIATFRYDIERHERFRDAGWHVIRVTADHLRAPAGLVARVGRALARTRHRDTAAPRHPLGPKRGEMRPNSVIARRFAPSG